MESSDLGIPASPPVSPGTATGHGRTALGSDLSVRSRTRTQTKLLLFFELESI